MHVQILVLRDCTPMVPIGFADMLRKTASLDAFVPGFPVRRDVRVSLVAAGKDRTVTAAGGVRILCDAASTEAKTGDLVLVPALDPDVVEHLEQNRDVVSWLKRAWLKGADLASACTGSFLLGEAGLLDGKAATTHWAFAPLFAHRYPRVRLQPEAVVVDQGRVITGGGATSFLNLSLYLIERVFGPEAGRLASRLFLVDVNKSPQSAYAIFGTQKQHGDPGVLRAQEIIERELKSPPAVDQLAKAVAMSRRNFVRRFKAATGNPPRDYLQRVRIEAAKRALETAPKTVADVSYDVGYADVVAFRKLFQRWTGLTPSEYRARYGPRTAPGLVTFRGAFASRGSRSRRRAP